MPVNLFHDAPTSPAAACCDRPLVRCPPCCLPHLSRWSCLHLALTILVLVVVVQELEESVEEAAGGGRLLAADGLARRHLLLEGSQHALDRLHVGPQRIVRSVPPCVMGPGRVEAENALKAELSPCGRRGTMHAGGGGGGAQLQAPM